MRKILLLSILIFAFTPDVWGQQTKNPTNMATEDNKPFGDLSNQGSNPYAQFDTSHPCEGTNCVMMPKGSVTDAGTTSYGPADTVCSSAKTKVDTICIGNNNPGIQTAVTLIASIGSAGLSITDACSKFNSALKTANEAIMAYNTACGAAGFYCENVCNTAAEKAQAAASATAGASMDLYNADMMVKNACTTSMKKNLKDAAYGLAGVIAGSALGASCQNQTTDPSAACTATTAANGSSTNPLCIKGVDCSNAANATNPTCICNSSPNSPGCPGATAYGSSYSSPSFGATTASSNTTATVLPAASGAGLNSALRNAAAPTAADGSTPGGGGGGAIAGDGMSAAATAAKAATADKKNSLNPNILSGFDGDGGGGGSRRGGANGDGSAYRAYMPGAAKDPSRALASQTAAGGQVTSAGSKSNWEKINERYSENKSTLMGE